MNGKKKLLIIAAVIVVIALSVGIGVYMYSNSPARRLRQQLDLGARYLSELKYDDAIAAYEAALAIDPKSAETKAALTDTYLTWMNALAEEESLDDLMGVYRLAEQSAYLEEEQVGKIRTHAAEAFLAAAARKTEDGMYEEAMVLYGKVEEITSDEELLSRSVQGIIETLTEIARHAEGEDAIAAWEKVLEYDADNAEALSALAALREEKTRAEEQPEEIQEGREVHADAPAEPAPAPPAEEQNQLTAEQQAERDRQIEAEVAEVKAWMTADETRWSAYQQFADRGWTVISHSEDSAEGDGTGTRTETGVCEKDGRRVTYQWRRVFKLYFNEEYQMLFIEGPALENHAEVNLE